MKQGSDIETFPATVLPTTLGGRYEMLLDMYAPMVEREDGTWDRDPEYGIISREQFLRLLEESDG